MTASEKAAKLAELDIEIKSSSALIDLTSSQLDAVTRRRESAQSQHDKLISDRQELAEMEVEDEPVTT